MICTNFNLSMFSWSAASRDLCPFVFNIVGDHLTFAFARALPIFTFRFFSSLLLLVVCRLCPVTFLDAVHARVSTFGTRSFAAFALYEGVNIHGHRLQVLSDLQVALNFFAHTTVVGQFSVSSTRGSISGTIVSSARMLLFDVIGKHYRGSLLVDPDFLFPLRYRTVETSGVERSWLQLLRHNVACSLRVESSR